MYANPIHFTLAIGMPKGECLDPREFTVNFPIAGSGHSSANGNHFPLSRESKSQIFPLEQKYFSFSSVPSLPASVASGQYSQWNIDSLPCAWVWNPHC
jgi:hypothetical protein